MTNKICIVIEKDYLYSVDDYIVTVNDKIINPSIFDNENRYYTKISTDKCDVKIVVEDIWADRTSRTFMFLRIFDAWFSQAMENLPLFAEYSQIIMLNNESDKKIILKSSSILKVSKSALHYWNIYAIVQMIMTLFLLTGISILLSLSLNQLIRTILCISTIILCIVIFIFASRRRKEVYKN